MAKEREDKARMEAALKYAEGLLEVKEQHEALIERAKRELKPIYDELYGLHPAQMGSIHKHIGEQLVEMNRYVGQMWQFISCLPESQAVYCFTFLNLIFTHLATENKKGESDFPEFVKSFGDIANGN